MSLRFPNGAFARDKTFNREKLDAVITSLDRAIHALELTKIDWLQQVTLFQTNALKRVADAVQPIVDQLRTAVEGGFLVATTDDLVELVEGEEVSFFIPEEARVAYRPTPFLAILAPDEREDWAIGRLLVYNDQTGLLTVEILHVNGSGAERNGWTLAASSGVVEAVYQWMRESEVARDAAIAKAAEALSSANAAAVSAAAALASKIDAQGFTSAAEAQVVLASAQRALAAASAVAADLSAQAAAASAASIAGGPVASINGLTGIVTGIMQLAGAQDITGLKTVKVGAAATIADWLKFQPTDYATGKPLLRIGKKLTSATSWIIGLFDGTNNAGTLDFDVANLTHQTKRVLNSDDDVLGKNFVASGAIAAGQYVALRSDGKVEAIAGTETLPAIGADVNLTVAQTFNLVNAAHNAATNKLALLYYNASVANTLYLVVGTVVDGTITFGAPLTIGSIANYFNNGNLTWNVSGSTLLLTYLGASSFGFIVAGTVSGTTVTLGTAINVGAIMPRSIFHDDTHGSRVIFVDDGGVMAATYSGNTLTAGTRVALTLTNASNRVAFYDAANARGVTMAGQSGSNVVYAKAFTVSGTTVTVGAEASQASYFQAAAYDYVSGKAVFFLATGSTAAEQLWAAVVTFSGATATINTRVRLTDAMFLTYPGRVATDMVSGKILAAGSSRTSSGGAVMPGTSGVVCTISGTTISATAPFGLALGSIAEAVLTSTSGAVTRFAIIYKAELDFERSRVVTGRIVSGAFVIDDDVLIRSSPQTNSTFWANALNSRWLVGGWTLFNFGNWGIANNSTLLSFGIALPEESTNAGQWIGVARAAAANAANVPVTLRGGLDKSRSGLTVGSRYFLKGDGSLVTNDNGRPAGRAVSATELLMEAA